MDYFIIQRSNGFFRYNNKVITETTDLNEVYHEMTETMFPSIDQYQNEGSGWVFDRVVGFDIHINPFELLTGGSYIPLPKVLSDKKAIINVRNENDNECFKWAVTSAVFPEVKY